MSTIRTAMALGPADAGRVLTSEEFAEADFEEPWIFEREHGRLIVMSPEGQRHIDGTRPWLKGLVGYWVTHPEIVEDVVPQAWLRVDEGTDRIGDLGVYLVRDVPAPPIPDRTPDLMFEVVSPGRESRTRDYVLKRREYRHAGIREYVVVDRAARRVSVYTRGPRGFRRRVLRAGDVYETPLLPGLAIPIIEVL